MSILNARPLARTYAHPSRVDPWEAVELYRETQRYPDDWGSQRVASAMDDVSRSEVRAWVDGDGKPDAVRAIDVADDLGWLDDQWTPTTQALAQLVAGLFACGSVITENYVPSWSPDDDVASETIETALETIGVGSTHVTRNADNQADEVKPATHASILGRALVVAGAPVGHKTADSVREVPEWLDDAPMSVRASFVELLVRDRGVEQPKKATRRIQTDRARGYFEAIAELVEDVTGESATASDVGVTISADAVRALGLK